jgi:hypothetical protein
VSFLSDLYWFVNDAFGKLLAFVGSHQNVLKLLEECFFDLNGLKTVAWPLWPVMIFLLFRWFRPLTDKKQAKAEVTRLVFYLCLSVGIFLVRVFTYPFSYLEHAGWLLFPVVPFLFPVVMFAGSKSFPGHHFFGKWFGSSKGVGGYLRNVVLIFGGGVYISFLVALTLVVMLFYGLGYRDFMGRDGKYYAKLSDACNDLLTLAKKNHYPNDWTASNNDSEIPILIRQLHATKVQVIADLNNGESEVWLMIGVTRPGFGISWIRHEFGNGDCSYEISTIVESMKQVVYSANGSLAGKVR